MRWLSPLPAAVVLALPLGCSGEAPVTQDDNVQEQVTTSDRVVVADPAMERSADVRVDRVTFASSGDALLGLPPGALIVGGRGPAPTKNPDGFLRRLLRADRTAEGIVVMTGDAPLTDILFDAHVRAVSAGIVDYDGALQPTSAPVAGGATLDHLHVEAKERSIFESDEGARHESARLVRATIDATPAVQLDLRIKGGATSRLSAIVDADLSADLEVALEARGPRARGPAVHTTSIPLYASPRVPLPERRVGRVPVASQVAYAVTLDCSIRFDGESKTSLGLRVRGHTRVEATYEGGRWSTAGAPAESAAPVVTFDAPGSLAARCALTTRAAVGAYARDGVTIAFGPYVTLDVEGGTERSAYRSHAGATAGVGGNAEVFGVTAKDAPVADWLGTSIEGVRARPEAAIGPR